ncbi:MFS transporter [Streptacidiphilus fuscans]|uniref:MFS transporter n=1 Tax=Streptacidiphilus fuscans TaxID=2789292 RepID=A0A931B5Z2_9ACTN|nr:MFS transporter [Streptacidiphilus fuscans]MBF9067515.1 MFS transporter [Streptacidiphilus fuscans]
MTRRTAPLVAGICCIGTSELLPGGMLSQLGSALNVGVATAGLLVTVYAVTVALAGPVVTVLTVGAPKSRLATWLLGVFVVGNIVIATAANFPLVLLGRVITASVHGAYLATAIVVTQRLLPVERSAKAVTAIQFGVNLATVLGIPAGAALAQLGGWRTPFVVISGVAALATWGVHRATVHLDIGIPEPNARQEISALLNIDVGLTIGATALFSGAMFTIITYFEPSAVAAGFHDAAVPVLLVAYGAASILGNSIGGRLAGRARGPRLLTAAAFIVGCAAFLPLQRSVITFPIGAVLFALATFSLIPVLQSDVLDLAAAAPSLSLSTNMSAFGVGAALGSFAGGQVIRLHSVHDVPVAAVVLALGGFVLYGWRHLRPTAPAPVDRNKEVSHVQA